MVGVEACWGAAVPGGLILVEQEAEAPCQEEQEEAWASEAYLHGSNKASSSLTFVHMDQTGKSETPGIFKYAKHR